MAADAPIPSLPATNNPSWVAAAMAKRGSAQPFPLLLLLLAVRSHSVDAQINVIPSYPDSGNYNLVRLTCKDDFNDPVDADFVANGSLVTPDSTLVSVQETESSYIQFVFTQSQESFFLCRAPNGGQESEPIALAGILHSTGPFYLLFTPLVCSESIIIFISTNVGVLNG